MSANRPGPGWCLNPSDEPRDEDITEPVNTETLEPRRFQGEPRSRLPPRFCSHCGNRLAKGDEGAWHSDCSARLERFDSMTGARR